jgi:thymidylate synthase (FAD)
LEFVSKSTVRLEEAAASDISVARAAWVSNIAEDAREKDAGNIEGLINFLYRNRHMSPFEHGMLKFYIETPIFVAREFMRHRTFSYNEMSGRYMELPPRFYVAPAERPLVQSGSIGNYTFVPGDSSQIGYVDVATRTAYESSYGAYKNMLHAGVAKEVARNVLPVGTMTQFYVTGNPRNWMQFLALRDDKHALYEIRQVAQQIAVEFEKTMPLTYAAFKQYDWRNTNDELEAALKRIAQLEAQAQWDRPIGGPQ